MNENTGPQSVILLTTTDGIKLNAVWKQRKEKWFVVEQGNKKNVVDVFTPRQFHEAIENGKYSFTW